MEIRFTKMHGLGNDFMVIDNLPNKYDITKLNIPQLADRHLGIGFDQLLVIAPSQNADAYCYIYNADGTQAEQCGNGLRCIARYLHEQKIITSTSMKIETRAGIFPITIQDYNHICVTLTPPVVEENLVELKLPSRSIPVSIIQTGNPHAILKVSSLDTIAVETLGDEIASHEYFPQGANVGFLEIINRQHARLRTRERGVGETHACGSNACAAAVAGIVNKWLDHQVKLEFRFGSLIIEWEGVGKPIQMTGPAATVYQGTLTDQGVTK